MVDLPARIQRRRTKGCRMPPGAVYVGRGSKWGNPVQITRVPAAGWHVYGLGFARHFFELDEAKRFALDCFRYALHKGELAYTVDDVRRELRGKPLACWCALPAPGQPDLCHGAVLLAVANS